MINRSETQPYYYQYRYMRESSQNPGHPQYHAYGAQGITCAWGKRQYNDFYTWLISTLGERPGPSNEWVLGRKDKAGNWSQVIWNGRLLKFAVAPKYDKMSMPLIVASVKH